MITDDDSPDATGLDRAGQALFDRIATKLGLPITPEDHRIDRFVIRGELGRGGMGVVHRAFDPDLDREVALKLINARSFAKLDVLRARLIQEAKVLAQLEHPNVVRVYEVGEHAGEVHVALELVAGPDLRTWQRDATPTREQIIRVFIAAGSGLAAAHARGIVHRDFKPDNVFIARDGRVLVGDFGLAGSITAPPGPIEMLDSVARDRLTNIGEVIGTTGYMPPEQLRGDEIDARSDQYAFCVSLWELLTGKRPFPVETRAELLAVMSEGAPSGGQALPRWLRAVLIRGLAADPDRRFPNMLALVERLEQGLARKRRRLLASGFGLAAIVTITSVTMLAIRESASTCPLERSLADLRESENWRALVDELHAAGHRRVLTRLEARLEHRVAKLCPSDRDAAKQQLQLWFDALGLIAASVGERSADELVADIGAVADADFDRPPPEPIPPRVAEQLLLSEQAEREGRLDEALSRADEALTLAESSSSPAGRALALLRRGRVHSHRDHGELALADYRQARRAAYEARYPDAVVRADLSSAAAEINTLDRWDQGESSLLDARAQLIGLREPFHSPRWTRYHELDASSSSKRREFERAASGQRRVLVRRLTAFDRRETGAVLLNLGNVHTAAGRKERAEFCYRFALGLLPEPSPTRHLAEYALGRLLVFGDAELMPERIVESRALLNAVIEADAGSRVSAMYTLLALAYRLFETDEAGRIADELGELLPHDPTITPRRRFEALSLIAMSKAERGLDYQPTCEQLDAAGRELPDGSELLGYFDAQMIATLGLERGRVFMDHLEARLPTLPEPTRLALAAELDRLRAGTSAATATE